jgi:hypothetical protein
VVVWEVAVVAVDRTVDILVTTETTTAVAAVVMIMAAEAAVVVMTSAVAVAVMIMEVEDVTIMEMAAAALLLVMMITAEVAATAAVMATTIIATEMEMLVVDRCLLIPVLLVVALASPVVRRVAPMAPVRNRSLSVTSLTTTSSTLPLLLPPLLLWEEVMTFSTPAVEWLLLRPHRPLCQALAATSSMTISSTLVLPLPKLPRPRLLRPPFRTWTTSPISPERGLVLQSSMPLPPLSQQIPPAFSLSSPLSVAHHQRPTNPSLQTQKTRGANPTCLILTRSARTTTASPRQRR